MKQSSTGPRCKWWNGVALALSLLSVACTTREPVGSRADPHDPKGDVPAVDGGAAHGAVTAEAAEAAARARAVFPQPAGSCTEIEDTPVDGPLDLWQGLGPPGDLLGTRDNPMPIAAVVSPPPDITPSAIADSPSSCTDASGALWDLGGVDTQAQPEQDPFLPVLRRFDPELALSFEVTQREGAELKCSANGAIVRQTWQQTDSSGKQSAGFELTRYTEAGAEPSVRFETDAAVTRWMANDSGVVVYISESSFMLDGQLHSAPADFAGFHTALVLNPNFGLRHVTWLGPPRPVDGSSNATVPGIDAKGNAALLEYEESAGVSTPVDYYLWRTDDDGHALERSLVVRVPYVQGSVGVWFGPRRDGGFILVGRGTLEDAGDARSESQYFVLSLGERGDVQWSKQICLLRQTCG